jgi:hypothetical protein
MHRELLRIGSPVFVNESILLKTMGFDALFHKYHEFVYIPDSEPWQRVNGTWRGQLGHILNDTKWNESCFSWFFKFMQILFVYRYLFIRMRSIHSFMGTIDTGYYPAYISEDRMDSFQITNPYFTTRVVAIYAQQSDTAMINFSGVTAGLSLEVYATMLLSWCALVILFALIENVRPSSQATFNW